MVGDVQVQKSVDDVPVKLKPGPWKTHEEAVHAVSFMYSPSADFPSPAGDNQISEADIFEKDPPLDLGNSTSKDDRGPYPFHRVQALC